MTSDVEEKVPAGGELTLFGLSARRVCCDLRWTTQLAKVVQVRNAYERRS